MRRLARHLAVYLFHISFVRPVLFWGVGLRYRRRSLAPKGPCLVVSNHNSHLDAAILMTLFPLRRLPNVHPVAAADYFGTTWIWRTLALLFMNGIPIERNPGRGADPLQPLVEALQAGKTLVFFPEGSRGKAGVVAPFRAGIGKLVQKVPGLLVLPVFLSGPERIWARGQVVPVPLNIDATVGKPRTYDPQLDAKTIADQVRNDVLALAPPPPPTPEPRPAPPLRIAICGVDAQTQKQIFRALVQRLGASGRTFGLADPPIEAHGDQIQEAAAPIPFARGRAWIGLLPRIFRTGGRYQGRRFVDLVERAQVDEALSHDTRRRFLVTEGSPLVDLLAWSHADFYRGLFDASGLHRLMRYLAGQRKIPFRRWWRFIRHAPEVWLVNTFDLARPPVPDIVVLVKSPVTEVMERLRARGDELGDHETEDFLERMQQGYTEVAELLRKRNRAVVVEVDPNDTSLTALVEQVLHHTEQQSA